MLMLSLLCGLLLAGCAGKAEEPEPAIPAAPLPFDPPAAGKSTEGEVGSAAQQAAGIRPDLSERPSEEIQPPGEAEPAPEPPAETASAPE